MKWTEEAFYGPVFADLTASNHSLGNTSNGNSSDKFSLLENDYVWGDKKVRKFVVCHSG